jgi:hypothetical protein
MWAWWLGFGLGLAAEPVGEEAAPADAAVPPAVAPAEAASEAPAETPDAGAPPALPPPPPPPADGPTWSFGDAAAPADAPAASTDGPTWSIGPDAAPAAPSQVSVGQFRFTIGGYVQYDLRFRPKRLEYGSYYQDVPDLSTLSRNELMTKLRVGAKTGNYGLQADVDFVIRAYPAAEKLSELSQYNRVSPFRFEMHDLYLYGRDLFGAKGLDLRIGQQKVMFGVGDQFNPTNTINANDLEDILLFGDQVGNLMVRADYSPLWNLTFTGILIPVFKPAVLPSTGYLAQTPDRYPFINDDLRYNLAAEQAFAADNLGYPTIVRDVSLEHPEFSAANMQGFVRVAASLGGQDLALSYYNGRSDIPQPIKNTTSQEANAVCEDPDDPESECVNGVLASDVVLTWPKMQVLGFNMTGQMNPFGKIHPSFKAIGYRLELAVIFPQETRLEIQQDNISFLGQVKDGEYPYPDGDNRIIDSRPFAKWTLGLDYQFNKHLYMNTQWVHGFVDEFGAGDWIQPGWTTRASGIRPGVQSLLLECMNVAEASGQGESCAEEWYKPRLGDYLVWGTDIRFAAQRGLLRLFTIWDLIGVYNSSFDPETGERIVRHYSMFTKQGFSAVLYPALSWTFGNGLDLQAGALVQLGKPWSKFGAPETGSHQIWLRGRYAF